MIEEHLEDLRQQNYSKATINLTIPWLLHFQEFCGGRDPAELKPKDLEQWQKFLAWNPGPSGKLYSEATVNQAVGAIRRFYRWGLAAGKFPSNPTETLVTPKAKQTRSQKLKLHPQELRKIFSLLDSDHAFGIRDRAVLGVLVETGITRPTCSRIDRDHLCFDTGALLTRGRTQQIHSLTDGLLADLQRYLRDARPLLVTDITPALFLNSNGNRLSGPSIQQFVNKARKLAAL